MHENDQKFLDEIYAQAKSFFNDEGDKEAHIVELLAPYLSICKDKGYAWYMYGESLRVLGRAKEALIALENALEFASSEGKNLIYPRIGMLYSDHISPLEAEKWFQQATQDKATTPGWVWAFRGSNLAHLAEYEKALECHHAALLSEDVDREECYLNIGCVLRAMGQYSEAVEAFNKALEITPAYPEAQSALKGLQGIEATLELAAQIHS